MTLSYSKPNFMFIGGVVEPYRTLLRFYCDFNFIVRVLEGHLIVLSISITLMKSTYYNLLYVVGV